MFNFFSIIVLLCILSGVSVNAKDESLLTIDSQSETAVLGQYLSILEDKKGSLTISDVSSEKMSQQFIPSDKDFPGFGFTASTYWLKLTVHNSLNTAIKWYLESKYPLIDYISLYTPNGTEGWVITEYGDYYPFDSGLVNL